MSFAFFQDRGRKTIRQTNRYVRHRSPRVFGCAEIVRGRLETLERRLVLSAGIALDPTFGQGGLVTTDVPGKTVSPGESVAVTQPDGKIVVAGYSYNPAFNSDFLVARYNSDGSLDDSFGTHGIVTTDFYGGNDYARSIAMTPDGKIVVAGYSDEFTSTISGDAFAVARYNSDGSLDTTFGSGGKVVTDPSNDGASYVFSMAVDGSGRVVVVGNAFINSLNQYQLAIARYDADGTPDSSFGTSGAVVTGLGYTSADGRAVAIDGNGQIVVAGDAGAEATIARFNDNGTLDTSFGTSGVTRTSFGGSGEQFDGLTIDGSGRMDAAGTTFGSGTYNDFAVARYTSTGALDTTFGSGGKVTTVISSGNDVAEAVTMDTAGGIIVVGSSGNQATAVRYTSAGALDTAFGAGGITDVSFGGDDDLAFAAAPDPLGYLVLAGRTDRDGSDSIALAKLTASGGLNATFGSAGEVVTAVIGSTANGARGTAIQSDGKIVTVGGSGDGQGKDFALTRYNADGTLDTTFGQQGIATTRFFSAPGRLASGPAEAVTIDPQGRLVVVGVAGTKIAVVRYLADGSPDTTFGSGGQEVLALGSYGNDSAQAVAIDGNGKIVVAGWASVSQQNDRPMGFAVLRLNGDGTFDTTFGGGNGWVVTDFAGGADQAFGVVVQSDGMIVLAGTSQQFGNTGNDFALARYNSDGTLDSSFGVSGLVTTDFGDSDDQGYGMTSDASGRLIVAGASYRGATGYDFAVARYNTDGSLDTTFGGSGKVVTDFNQANDFAGPVTVGSDGKIIAAGEAYDGSAGFDFALARYNPDGTLDTTFTPTGKLNTDFAGQRDQIYGIAWQDPAHLVAVGSTYRPATSYDIGVARYLLQTAPTVSAGGPYTLSEGDSLTLAATASDPDGDPLSFSWDINGDGVFGDATSANPTLSWADLEALSPAINDGPATLNVTVRVDDGQGNVVVSAPVTLTVLNAPPTTSVTGTNIGVRGQPQTLTLSANDPSPVDQAAAFSYLVDWGDGSPQQTIAGPSSTQATHIYADSGAYQVQEWATDKDGGQSASPAVFDLTIQAAALEGGTLVVGGTPAADTIVLAPADLNGNIKVVISSVKVGVFHPTDHILVYAQAGNDHVNLQKATYHLTPAYIAVPAVVFGGDGNDVINASGSVADDILLGEAGNDSLRGGSGRNLLIGGLGNDTLNGGSADDIVIAGTTDFDGNLAALIAIMDEWGRTDLAYQDRLNHLTGAVAGGLNGSDLLTATTVHDDAAVDRLHGNAGQDWFFYHPSAPYKDVIADKQSDEVATTI